MPLVSRIRPSDASAALTAGRRATTRRALTRTLGSTRSTPWFLTRKASGRERLLQLLAFGLVPDEQRAVTTLDELEAVRAAWIAEHGDTPLDDTQLRELLRSAVRSTIATIDAPPLLGLTAGFDSRPLLHILHELGVRPTLYLYSQPGHIDHDVVMWLNERLGLGVELFDTRHEPFSLDIYDRHARTQNPSPLGPGHQGWYWALDRFGRSTLLHGFLNDTLTGDNRGKIPASAGKGPRSAFMAFNNQFGLQSEFEPALLDALCPGEAVSPDRGLELYRQYDLAYRQYGRISPMPGCPHDYRFPFADSHWMGYWLNRPVEERKGQHRWYTFVRSLGSELFADLDGLDAFDGRALRMARKRRFYGSADRPGLLDFSTQKGERQREPAHPFDFVTAFRANPSFRTTVETSLRRLRGRGLVDRGVIDAVETAFQRGDHAAGLIVNAFMTIDVHVEAEVV